MPYSFDQLRELFSPEKAAAMVKGAAAPFTDVTYPQYSKSIKDADLVDVNLGRKPLDKEIESLYNLLGDDLNIIATPDGFHVRNFSSAGNDEFRKLSVDAVRKVIPTVKKDDVLYFRHGGGLIEGGQNGRGYIREISNRKGLGEVARTERLYGQKVAAIHDEFAKKYGWKSPYQYEGLKDTLGFLEETSPIIQGAIPGAGEVSALTVPQLLKSKKSEDNLARRAGLSRFN